MLFGLIEIAVKNIKRKKLRTFMSMLGIIIGVASVTTVMAIGEGGKSAVNGQLDRLGMNGLSIMGKASETGAIGLLTDEEYETVKAFNPDNEAMPVKTFNNCFVRSAEGKKDCIVWGIGDNAEKTIALSLDYGEFFDRHDLDGGEMSCIIDKRFAQYLFKRDNVVGKEIELVINGQVNRFAIKGVISSDDNVLSTMVSEFVPDFIYIPYTTLKNLYHYSSYDQIIVNVDTDSDADEYGRQITAYLSELNGLEDGYTAENLAKQKGKLESIVSIIIAIVSAVAFISLIVGGIGIMTIMLVAANERKREIGLKKAVGATKGMIVFEFVAEAVIITLSGGVIGVGLSYLLADIFGKIVDFSVRIDWTITVMALIFSVIIGIIFSVYPAVKAADMNPIESLRSE